VSILKRYLLPAFIGLGTFAALQFYSQSGERSETAQMACVFQASEKTGPLGIPYSQATASRVDFTAELTGKSVHEGGVLWHGKGSANIGGKLQQLSGSVFLTPDNAVRALSLYRDYYPHTAEDLRISTLNEDGILDWNDKTAFIYFVNASNKMAHAFDYRCTVTNGESR
jgi:hypothetical protein